MTPERIRAAWRSLPPDHFNAEEQARLLAFAATPAALKLVEGFPELIRGVLANAAPHAPRMGEMTSEVFKLHTEEFARRLGELKIAPARARGPQNGGRRPRR